MTETEAITSPSPLTTQAPVTNHATAMPSPQPGDLVKRQRLSTRLWHWVNVVCLLVLLSSGLMIFNAHPRLYWGQYGANPDSAWLEIGDKNDRGFLQLGSQQIDTDGVLGRWHDANGAVQSRAFPHWITLPSSYSLAIARRWHMAFALLFAFALTLYMGRSLFNGHIRGDLHIRRAEWSPKHIWGDIVDHARLRFPTGVAALRYNIRQKFSYISVIFILLPLMIGTGLTMSPGIDAAWPWLLDLFGGRQSARSIHFITAFLLVAFFFVHIAMVLLAGPINEVRSIVTGNYRLPAPRKGSDGAINAEDGI
jgi:thiosulfate reductase cytochrome b subunit